MIVYITASLVVASLLLTSYFSQCAIDPHVTMEVGPGAIGKQASPRQGGIATSMNGEVARTAERISEATALALSAGLYAAKEQINGRTQLRTHDLIAGITAKNILPPGLTFNQSGSLVSTYGALFIRYRPSPLGIEVVSLGHKPEDGPALIVRIPDEFSDKGEARLFIAGSMSNVRMPAPFAPAVEVIALGWSPEILHSLK